MEEKMKDFANFLLQNVFPKLILNLITYPDFYQVNQVRKVQSS